jgi:hypothetical protein
MPSHGEAGSDDDLGLNNNASTVSQKANELWTLSELESGDIIVAKLLPTRESPRYHRTWVAPSPVSETARIIETLFVAFKRYPSNRPMMSDIRIS